MTSTTFALAPPPKTMFGVGVLDRTGETVPDAVESVLIVADPAFARSPVVDRLIATLAGRRVTVFDDIRSDPTETQVESGIAALKDAAATMVIVIGGGSALDAGKAIAALANTERPVSAYRLGETRLPRRRVGLITIPTTAGTGSEATRTAILSAPDGVKYWFWGDPLASDMAILDPALTVTLPAHLTAATGLDALVHAIEAATNVDASPASRLYGLEAIRIVARSLERTIAAPDDIEARGAMIWAAFLAGCALNLAGTAMAHCLGHALGSLAHIHHGRAVAIAMAAGADVVARANPSAFADVAVAMGSEFDAEAFPEAFRGLAARTGLDLTLPPDAANVTAEALAGAAMEPANIAMLQATVGDFGREEVGSIAARITAAAPAFA